MGRANSVMPRLAAHDSANPTECTRNGSTSSNAMAASSSTRTPWTGRPRWPATSAIDAITIARSTDGSQRVMVPKSTSTDSAPTRRPRNASRRSTGAISASTNATFSPDTAVRCESPAARKSSVSSRGTPRVSPSRNPASSARSVGVRELVPRSTAARAVLAARIIGAVARCADSSAVA